MSIINEYICIYAFNIIHLAIRCIRLVASAAVMEITCQKVLQLSRLCASWSHPLCKRIPLSGLSAKPFAYASLPYRSVNMSAKVSEVTLNTGAKMPAFGLG